MSKGVDPESFGEWVYAPKLQDEMSVSGQCVDSGFRQLALVRKSFQVRRDDIRSATQVALLIIDVWSTAPKA